MPGLLLLLPLAVPAIVLAARPARRFQHEPFAAESLVATGADGGALLRPDGAVDAAGEAIDVGASRSEDRGIAAKTSNAATAIALAALVLLTACAATAGAATGASAIKNAVRSLEADHDSAVAAVHTLQAGGAPAAEAIRDAWPSLSVLARTRAIAALAQLASDHDAAVDALVEAARSEDEALRRLGLSALGRAGARGREGLAGLLPDPSVGDAAASALASAAPELAVERLLVAFASDGGADRPALREALAIAVERAERAPAELGAWLATRPPPTAVASAALGLGSLAMHRGTAASFIEHALPNAQGFPTLWRLLEAARSAGPSDLIDRWVRSQLRAPEEWMLRQAAVDAMASRGQREEARVALADPYPRVRAQAAAVLAGDPGSLLERATLARRDPWPMVRAAAVASLRNEQDAVPVIVAAVDDSMSLVRTTAIEALATASHEDGWDRIHRRLRARDEWPQVTAAAIDYAAAHCRADAVQALLGVVARAAPGDAPIEDLNNAARAIEVLRVLGGSDAEAALAQLRRASAVPPTLKMALERPLPEAAKCPPAGR
jgi:hypothetical protein